MIDAFPAAMHGFYAAHSMVCTVFLENGVEFLPHWPELMGALSLLGKQNLCMGLSLLHTLSTNEWGGGGRGEETTFIMCVSSMVETH